MKIYNGKEKNKFPRMEIESIWLEIYVRSMTTISASLCVSHKCFFLCV